MSDGESPGEPRAQDPYVARVPAELEPLIPRFLQKRIEEEAVIRDALDRADMEALARVGHALKGTAGGYGFHELTDMGAKLERAARAGDVEGCESAARRIAKYVRQVTVEFVDD